MKQRENSAAIYCRLSRDDGADSESNSIHTQRMMLRRYAKEQGFTVFSEYVDDGISGTTFDRDAFKRMIADIEDGKVSIVLCKDLSRLGRNNALVAYYCEIHFVEYNVRLIALNDGIDTGKGDNEIMAFKSVINEYYARDISKKVRSAKRTRALNGEHNAGRAPYGYIKNPADKHKLIIDETAAEVVRHIYRMAYDGLGMYQIARRLSDAGIPTPAAYEYERSGKLHSGFDPDFPCDWHSRSVQGILTSQTYIGNLVSHRQTTKSFKNHKVVRVPEDEWIIVEGTHEGVIDRKLFDDVQRIISVKKRPNKHDNNNFFAGFLQCPDCGKHLTYHSDAARNGKGYYNCDSYRHGNRTGDNRKCTQHRISRTRLVEAVTQNINFAIAFARQTDKSEDEILRELLEQDSPNKSATAKKALEKLKRRDSELRRIMKKLFEQNALGVIDDAAFSDMYGGYQAEQREVTEKMSALEAELSETSKASDNAERFLSLIRQYDPVTELNRTILLDLVDRIVIYEAEPAPDGELPRQRVDVFYKFIGALPHIFPK